MCSRASRCSMGSMCSRVSRCSMCSRGFEVFEVLGDQKDDY